MRFQNALPMSIYVSEKPPSPRSWVWYIKVPKKFSAVSLKNYALIRVKVFINLAAKEMGTFIQCN